MFVITGVCYSGVLFHTFYYYYSELKNIIHYSGVFIIWEFIISKFNCTWKAKFALQFSWMKRIGSPLLYPVAMNKKSRNLWQPTPPPNPKENICFMYPYTVLPPPIKPRPHSSAPFESKSSKERHPRISTPFILNNVALYQSIIRLNCWSLTKNKNSTTQSKPASVYNGFQFEVGICCGSIFSLV